MRPEAGGIRTYGPIQRVEIKVRHRTKLGLVGATERVALSGSGLLFIGRSSGDVSFVAVAEKEKRRTLQSSVISRIMRLGLYSTVFINVPGIE